MISYGAKRKSDEIGSLYAWTYMEVVCGDYSKQCEGKSDEYIKGYKDAMQFLLEEFLHIRGVD